MAGSRIAHYQGLVHESLVLEIASKAGHRPLATLDKALARLTGAQKR